VAPHVERKGSVGYFDIVGDRAGPYPATLFIEPCGALVANRARKPSDVDAALAKPIFRIGHENCGNSGARSPNLSRLLFLHCSRRSRSDDLPTSLDRLGPLFCHCSSPHDEYVVFHVGIVFVAHHLTNALDAI
jgi:hypothetical protein